MKKNTKPIILVVGAPHSYTSMVSSFLLSNGGYNESIDHGSRDTLDYDKYEDARMLEFADNAVKFKKTDIEGYLESLPTDKTVIIKVPRLLFFIDTIKNHRVKVVYVMRNPEDNIRSHMLKNSWSFVNIFNKYCWYYDFAVHSPYPIFTLQSERLIRKCHDTASRLLEFCGLANETINFETIQPIKIKRPSYIKYRFSNFVWKKISVLFKLLLK